MVKQPTRQYFLLSLCRAIFNVWWADIVIDWRAFGPLKQRVKGAPLDAPNVAGILTNERPPQIRDTFSCK